MHTFNIILSLLACTIIIGCGKQPGDDDIMPLQSDDGTITVQAGSDAQLPKNFPTDVYVHQNATILNAFTTPESTMIGFKTEDSVKTVAEQYKANMLKNRWAEKPILSMDDISMVSFSKKERTATVIITPHEATTQISLTLTAAPPIP